MKNNLMKSIVIGALIFLLIVPSVTTLYGNAQSANSSQASVTVEQTAPDDYLITINVYNNSTLFAYDTVTNNVTSIMNLFEGSQRFYINVTANTLLQVFENEANHSSVYLVVIFSQWLVYTEVPPQITVTPYGTDYNVSIYLQPNTSNYTVQIQQYNLYGVLYNLMKTIYNTTITGHYYNFTIVPSNLGDNWYEYVITVWTSTGPNNYEEAAYVPIVPVQVYTTYTMSSDGFHIKMYLMSANNMTVNLSVYKTPLESFVVHGNGDFIANQSVVYTYNLSYLQYIRDVANNTIMGINVGGPFNVTVNGTQFTSLQLPGTLFLSHYENNTNTTAVMKMPSTPLALTVFNTAMLFGMLFWLAAFSYAFLSQNGKRRKYTKSQLIQLNIFPVINIISGAVAIASGVEVWYGQGTIWYWIGGISGMLFVSVLYFFLFYSLWSTSSTTSKQPVLTTKMKMGREEKSKKGGN